MAYEDKVKGVMSGEPLVLFSNQFKECDQQEEAQQKIQVQFETAQKCQESFARFKKGGESQADIKFLTRDVVRQVIDWIEVYPADRSVWWYQQKL